MKSNLFAVLALSFLALTGSSASFAAAPEADSTTARPQVPTKTSLHSPHGYPSTGTPDRVIEVVAGKTKSLRVQRLETLRIVDGPRDVTWTFDTLHLPVIPLNAILPGAASVKIYVEENPMYAQ